MKRTKKAFVLVLSLSMLASISPQTVLASGGNTDRYEEVHGTQAIVQDAEVHVYTTKNGGTVQLTDSNKIGTTFPQGIGYREYKATPADGWRWKGWNYEQLYQGKDLGNRTDYGWGRRYSFSNDGSDWRSPYNGTGQTISVNRLTTTGETVGNKITYNLYANFNPTINATADTGGTIEDSGITEVEYGTNKQYTVTADTGKDIASVTVDGNSVLAETKKDSFTYTFENVTEPHTIHATFTDEIHTVSYEFVSGTAGEALPEEVSNLCPGSSTYTYGTEVTPTQPTSTSVKVSDGVWTFKGYDKENQTVTSDVKFTGTWTFAKNAVTINHIPTITAGDKTITVGDSFDPKKDVTASDKEDGSLTDRIEVINNTVNTSKVGTYTVTYKVTDKDGASVTKSITVTVKEKDKEEQTTVLTKPDNGNSTSTDTKKDASKTGQTVKTGDTSNVLLWSTIAILSIAGVVTVLFIKRRKSHS